MLSTLALLAVLVGSTPRTWTFDDTPAGQTPAGFTAEVGTWEVVPVGRNRVLAQQAENADAVLNVALAAALILRDVDLTVKLRPIAGALDQGGGLIWRARDARNYYVARYNPLEDNLRAYKVVDGRRTQLATAERVGHRDGWRVLRVTMAGDRIRCWLDDRPLLDVRDATFPDAGRFGLWTKADARTAFDDLTTDGP